MIAQYSVKKLEDILERLLSEEIPRFWKKYAYPVEEDDTEPSVTIGCEPGNLWFKKSWKWAFTELSGKAAKFLRDQFEKWGVGRES